MNRISIRKQITILHIAGITDDKCAGVNVAVAAYVSVQQRYRDVALLNLFDVDIDGIDNLFFHKRDMSIEALPAPFDNPDLIVFHEIYRFPFIGLYKEALRRNIPYIIVPHGGLTRQAQSRKKLKKKTANIIFFGKFVNNANRIQFLSESEKNHSLYNTRYFVIGNGINIPDRTKKGLNENRIFTYIGRMEIAIKGLDLLIKAVSNISDFVRESKCVFNLYGPATAKEKEQLDKLIISEKIEDIFFIHDAVFGEEKEKILLNTDYYIQTSRSEGMPMGVLEALSYGLPCVITRGTGLCDLIEKSDCGWTSENDSRHISEAILKAVSESNDYQKMSLSAAKTATRLFSWDNIVKEVINTYENVVAGDK